MITLLGTAAAFACAPADPVDAADRRAVELAWSIEAADPLGEDPFLRLVDAAVGPDGIVAVLDRDAPAVHVLDAEGTLLKSFGRRGEGPGELMRPDRIGFIGDTLWVSDPRLHRITWFSLDGAVHRTRSVSERTVAEGPWYSGGGEPLANGVVLAKLTTLAEAQVDSALSVPLILVDSLDAATRVASFDGVHPRIVRSEFKTGGPVFIGQLFDADPILRTAADGRWLFVLERAPARDRTGTIEIVRYAPSGDVLGRTSIAYQPVRMTRAITDSMRAYYLRGASEEARSMLDFDDIISKLWVPGNFPPVTAAFADSAGFWLRREAFHAPATWERYDLSGQIQARIALPADFRGLTAHSDVLIGFVKDSLDVPHLQKYVVLADRPEASR